MAKVDTTPLMPDNKRNDNPVGVIAEVRKFLWELIDLKEGLDKEGTIVNIKNNKKMAGANVWLLMCSIMIASLGLDLNSPAVIIGAMLISPLMSPILGVGLAVGLNDKQALGTALNHFLIAIIIALITSTVYFWLTPFGDETNEIRSRTAPTLLDVMVAFFGGVAGIISGSRKDKSNAIPGVAIATALMPPLCVTGYGIANGNWLFMANSFYLFFLNATFVALATFLIVRFLRFPMKKHIDPVEARKTRWIIIAFASLMIIPSGSILFSVLQKANQQKIIGNYFEQNFSNSIYQISPVMGTDSTEIKCIAGTYLKPEAIKEIEVNLINKGARNFSLNFLQDDDARAELEKLKLSRSENSESAKSNALQVQRQNRKIRELSAQLDSLSSDTLLFRNLTSEVRILFPELATYSFARNTASMDLSRDSASNVPLLITRWKEEERLTEEQKAVLTDKLAAFVKVRAGVGEIRVVEE